MMQRQCLYQDVLGVCGGDCAADADADGFCDDVDMRGKSMSAAYATVQALSTNVGALTFHKASAIATLTS